MRRIRDIRARELGRFNGSAEFVPDEGGLRFTERGLLVLPHARAEARRDYRFAFDSDRSFSVFFADGRFFHRAEIAGGIACVAHDCAPDLYRGRYRLARPDRWLLSWRISGPRKQLVISTVFSRTVDA